MTTTSDGPAEETGAAVSDLVSSRAAGGTPEVDVLPSAEGHVINQHVVSRVVLKPFEGQTPHGAKIGLYKIGFGAQRPIGRSKAGVSKNLLRFGSSSAERLWWRTENKIDRAVSDVRVSGSKPAPLSISVLRRAMELHFARSKETVTLLDGTWTNRSAAHIEALVDKYATTLAAHWRAKFDRTPTRADLIELVRLYTSDGE